MKRYKQALMPVPCKLDRKKKDLNFAQVKNTRASGNGKGLELSPE